MSFITNKGKEAKESINKSGGLDLKETFIKLKDGEGIRVRVMTDEDYVEYLSHGSFGKGIFTQPCIGVAGQDCAMCEASKYEGGEKDTWGNPEWNHLYAKKRCLFGFVNIDTGKKVVFDATKNQAKDVIGSIEEYADSIGDVAFTFKRTGTKNNTKYKLSPILKLKKAEQEAFDKADEINFDIEFFEMCLMARSREQQLVELKDAGFPMEEVFSDEDIKAMNDYIAEQKKKKEEGNGEGEPIAEGEEVDETDAF